MQGQSVKSRLHTLLTDPLTTRLVHRFRRDRLALVALGVVTTVFILAIGAPFFARYQPDSISLSNVLESPSIAHPFGTDYLGRDILSRVIWGARSVIEIIVYSTLIAGSIGTIVGAFSGFRGGLFDRIVMRSVDVIMSFPNIILALAIIAILGASLENAIIAVSLYQIAPYARLIRGEVLSARERPYVDNARAVGARDSRILFGHIMPNVVGPLIVQITFGTASALLSVAGLSFFGLGAQPPTADWGLMIYQSLSYFYLDPLQFVFPGLALVIVIASLNIIGESLRDALDPKIQTIRKII